MASLKKVARVARRTHNRIKPRYAWAGLQVNTTTDIPTAGVVAVLVAGTFVERHGSVTVQRIRGDLQIMNDDTDAANGAVNVAYKVMKIEINDAGTITGDHNALDTHEEDIAARILDQGLFRLGAAAASDFVDTWQRVHLDIKAKVRVHHAKEEVVLLLDSSVANRARFLCNLRALCKIN